MLNSLAASVFLACDMRFYSVEKWGKEGQAKAKRSFVCG